jgi:class 3 adenylate cyclase
MALFAARSREEYRRWHQMREQFDRYVSPAVAEYLMVSEANRRPGGQMGTATCLFLDLRDSVRFGATRPADTVMTDLNEMFAALVPAIQANGGSVFKYTGDGLMAVFNAPVASPEGDIGAQGAVDAARAMHRALAALNQRRWIRWQETRHDPLPDPWFPLVIGIGIHTGLLVFGNLGTADRPEFTVIGDTVNLAARLEALTKPDEINTPTVISDVTYHALRRRPPATDPIMRDIKGHGLIAVRGLTAETETEAVAKLENLPRERQGKLV